MATNYPKMQVVEAPRMKRGLRQPKLAGYFSRRAFVLNPMFIHPVLPGETLKNLKFQARAVTDPINSSLVGWWAEYYFFYVKLRDLAIDVTPMFTTPGTWDPLTVDDLAVNKSDWYHTGDAGAINYVQECTKVVTEWYFRDQGEAWNGFLIGNLPAVRYNRESWFDSMTSGTDYLSGDLNVDLDADLVIEASEVEKALRQYQYLKAANFTNETFEEYMAHYGVQLPTSVDNKMPELIRMSSNWQYPTNTIDPANGTPRSAVSWAIMERADKDRFFTEPGFIAGFAVYRPKVYPSNQRGTLTQFMNDVYSWLPATMTDDNEHSWRRFAAAAGPLNAAASEYAVDFRDLFVYGEDWNGFVSNGSGGGPSQAAAFPTAALQAKYPADANAHALFVDTTTNRNIKTDFVCQLSIASHVTDLSPTG